MEPDEYERMALLQDDHWWFAAKRRIVGDLVRQYAIRLTSSRSSLGRWALDVGCGTGAMIPILSQWGQVVGMDVASRALQHAGHRPLVEGDILHLPFADRRFHVLGCFDVLYHRRVGAVRAALQELRRVCHPQGLLIVTDSAFPVLRSSHDAALHGARRFRLGPLRQLVEAAGFRVIYASYFHALLFPLAVAVRLTKRAVGGAPPRDRTNGTSHVAPRSDLRPAPRWVNRALAGVYRLETALLRRTSLPFGLSVILLAEPAVEQP